MTTTNVLNTVGYYAVLDMYDPVVDAAFAAPFSTQESVADILSETLNLIVEQEYRALDVLSDGLDASHGSLPELESLVELVNPSTEVADTAYFNTVDQYQFAMSESQPAGFALDEAVDVSLYANDYGYSAVTTQAQGDEFAALEGMLHAIQVVGI